MPSAIGSGLGSLGGTLAGWGFPSAGTALGNLGNYVSPAIMPLPTDTPPSLPADTGSYGTPPVQYTDPTGAGTAASISQPGTVSSGNPNAGAGYSGGLTAPAESPENVMAPGTAATTGGGATGGAGYSPVNAPAAAPGAAGGGTAGAGGYDPNASLWQNVQAYLSNPKNWGSIIGGVGNIGQGVYRGILGNRLADPKSLMSLGHGMSKAMKRAVIGPVTAQAQETGQINAPGLYAQSVATALGPYQYQMQMQALADYIEALKAAGEMQGGPVYQGGGGS